MPNQTQPKGFDPQLLERQVEHRRDVRHLSVLRIAKLIDGQREVPCLISNVSSGGAKLRIYCPCSSGARIQVEHKSGHLWSGRIVWQDRSHVGIAFDHPIDVLDFLENEHRTHLRPRTPRFATSRSAAIRFGAEERTGRLVDISLGGACVTCPEPPEPGTRLVLDTASLPSLSGRVRWHCHGKIGIAFGEPIPFARFAAWIVG